MVAASGWALSEGFLPSLATERRAVLHSRGQTWEPERVKSRLLQDFNTFDLKITTLQKPLQRI